MDMNDLLGGSAERRRRRRGEARRADFRCIFESGPSSSTPSGRLRQSGPIGAPASFAYRSPRVSLGKTSMFALTDLLSVAGEFCARADVSRVLVAAAGASAIAARPPFGERS
jgi:hypothetical protein